MDLSKYHLPLILFAHPDKVSKSRLKLIICKIGLKFFIVTSRFLRIKIYKMLNMKNILISV